MRRTAEKIPEDWVICPECNLPYGFIKCRITLRNPTRNMCLKCAVQKEKDGTLKVILVAKQDMPLMGMGGAPGASGSPKSASVGSTPTPPAGMLF